MNSQKLCMRLKCFACLNMYKYYVLKLVGFIVCTVKCLVLIRVTQMVNLIFIMCFDRTYFFNFVSPGTEFSRQRGTCREELCA